MNDRFLFRAWDVISKTMVYLNKSMSMMPFYIKSKDWVLMQCTGLKDKNGKLIYEGDIVYKEYYPDLPTTKNLKKLFSHLVVKWLDKGAEFSAIDENGMLHAINYGGSAVKEWKIIGNKFENKELLDD